MDIYTILDYVGASFAFLLFLMAVIGASKL